MSIHREKKYPLNHARDAEAPATAPAGHATSDIDLSDEISEIKNVLANAFGASTATISESEEDELASFINAMEITVNMVYEGPRLRDAEEGETPAHSNPDES